jgi:hypothetical protein
MKRNVSLILGVYLSVIAASAAAQAPVAPATEATGSAAAAPKTSECVPECRQGFTCSKGACVTGCNPPCTAGQSCTPLGQCVESGQGNATASGSIPLMVPNEPQAHPELGPGDPGWAFAAGVLGIVGAVAETGLTAGTVMTHGKKASTAFGVAGLLTMAAVVPVVAVGGMSARDNPIIQGLPTVRVLSWVGYGVTLASGMGLLVYGADHKDVSPGLIAVTGMVGVLSTVGFAVDAFVSAHQATSPVGGVTELKLMPTFALVPGPDGTFTAALGASGRF